MEKKPIDKHCEHCEKAFTSINPAARFCSDTCRKASRRRKAGGPATVTIIQETVAVDRIELPVLPDDIPHHSMEDAGNRIWQKLISEFKSIVAGNPSVQASHDALEIFLTRVDRYGSMLTACQISALTERVANYRNGTYRVMNLQKLTKA